MSTTTTTTVTPRQVAEVVTGQRTPPSVALGIPRYVGRTLAAVYGRRPGRVVACRVQHTHRIGVSGWQAVTLWLRYEDGRVVAVLIDVDHRGHPARVAVL